VIRKRRDGLQVQVYAGRDPLTGRKRWSAAKSLDRPSGPTGKPRRLRRNSWSRLTVATSWELVEDRRPANRAVVELAPTGPADLACHRCQLSRRH
jgi:hypothetical protein